MSVLLHRSPPVLVKMPGLISGFTEYMVTETSWASLGSSTDERFVASTAHRWIRSLAMVEDVEASTRTGEVTSRERLRRLEDNDELV